MSKVNVVLELNETIASKLPTVKTRFEKGTDMLVVDGSVCGSNVMSLIMTWMGYNQNGEKLISVAGASDGQGAGRDLEKTALDDCFMLFVVKQSIPVLLELIEATIKLEVWPLLELACKTMANLIKDMDVAGVRKLLQLDTGAKLSTACIQSFLKYLPILKRLELDDIELKEWQLASNSLWSEQKVLYFGNTTQINENKCGHCNSIELEVNRVECSKQELTTNLESIRTNRRRKVAEKFLNIIRRCINLEVISWDANFGQMSDTKFARVLEQNCPHLVHIEGCIKNEFELMVNGKTSSKQPASFLDVFEPNKNITCFLVKYDDDLTNEQMVKFNDELAKTSVALSHNHLETIEADAQIVQKIVQFVTTVSTTKPAVLNEYWYLLDKVWFDKMKDFKTAMPGKIDNSSLLNIVNGEFELKDGLKVSVDYVLIHQDGWKLLTETFGLVNDNQVIKRPVVLNPETKSNQIEVYEIELQLSSYHKPKAYVRKKFSIAVKYDDLVKQMKLIYGIDEKKATTLRLNFELIKHGNTSIYGSEFESTLPNGRYQNYHTMYDPRYLKDKDIVTIA